MSRSKSLLTRGLLIGAALSMTAPATPAASRCRAVRGFIDSELLSGPECTSPVGLCTRSCRRRRTSLHQVRAEQRAPDPPQQP
jgi:hypothetical protein